METQVIRCSSLARPMVCPGFVFLKNLLQWPNDEAAKEGTTAGEYLERLLLNRQIADTCSNGRHFDDDMKFYTTPIAQDVKSRAVSEILCETRIDWQTRSGIWIRGQYDICFVDDQGRLCVEDLKYGYKLVEVKENWQLLGYAIGEVMRRGQAFNEISFKIHQPRAHHEDGTTREWVITYDRLIEYKEMIEKRMSEISSGRKDFQTSDKCYYCMGAGEGCPAFNRKYHNGLEIAFGNFVEDSISDEEMAKQLNEIANAEEALKIKLSALKELAVSRIKKGHIIPGYVQSQKYSNRSWKKGVSPESIKIMTGKDVIETKLMTPAKAEKLGVSKELVSQLSEKRFVGMKLEKKNATDLGNKIFGKQKPQGGR